MAGNTEKQQGKAVKRKSKQIAPATQFPGQVEETDTSY